MVADERTTEADLTLASQNLRVLMGEMDQVRTRLGLAEFHERTVSDAFLKLCPGFWPFC
jgi:hypothetical protein